jgi:hypothetical protein
MNNVKNITPWLSLILIGVIILSDSCQKQLDEPITKSDRKRISIFLTDVQCNFDWLFVDTNYVEKKIYNFKSNRDNNDNRDDDYYRDHDRKYHDSNSFRIRLV